jgi:hypothetical protein
MVAARISVLRRIGREVVAAVIVRRAIQSGAPERSEHGALERRARRERAGK